MDAGSPRMKNVSEETKVRKIKSFTAEYLPTEDRIRLNCIDLDGGTFAFWFTQRLLNKFIAASVLKIEKSNLKTEAMQNSRAYAASLNHLEQQVARQQKLTGPQIKPIKVQANPGAWLCQSVDIVTVTQGFQLQFKPEEGGGEKCTMVLTTLEYRNILDIMFKTYTKADWSIGVFPSWLDNSRQLEQTGSLLN